MMKQNERFNNVLNECLDRILKGEAIEKCLRDYPEQAAELEPLLRTAAAARAASATLQPRAEFKARARYEFQAALRDMESHKKKKWFSFNWRPQIRLQTGWAIGLASVLVVVLGGGGTVAAASNSMPDSALYSIKLASEQAQLVLTPSDIGKAELNAKFANRRTDELEYLVNKGDAQEVQNVASLMQSNLMNITVLTGDDSGSDTTTQGSSGGGLNFGSDSTPTEANDQAPMINVASAPVASAPESDAPTQVPATRSSEATAVPPDATGAVVGAPNPMAVAPPITTNASKSFTQDTGTRNSAITNTLPLSVREQLRKIIEESYLYRKARLEALLEQASPSVRPAIKLAIAKSEAEYWKSIRNLGLGE